MSTNRIQAGLHNKAKPVIFEHYLNLEREERNAFLKIYFTNKNLQEIILGTQTTKDLDRMKESFTRVAFDFLKKGEKEKQLDKIQELISFRNNNDHSYLMAKFNDDLPTLISVIENVTGEKMVNAYGEISIQGPVQGKWLIRNQYDILARVDDSALEQIRQNFFQKQLKIAYNNIEEGHSRKNLPAAPFEKPLFVPQPPIQQKMSTRLTHAGLLNLYKQFGYDFTFKGTCAGFAAMSAQSFLLRNKKGNDRVLLDRLLFAEENLKAGINIKDKFESLKQKRSPNETGGKPNVLSKEEQDYFDKALDLQAWLDGMVLHQDPYSYSHIFGQRLTQFNNHLIRQVTVSNEGEEEGIVEVNQTLNVFNKDEMKNYFAALRKELDEKKQDIALYMSSGHHAITVCYDHEKKGWMLYDANTLDDVGRVMISEGNSDVNIPQTLKYSDNNIAKIFCEKAEVSDDSKTDKKYIFSITALGTNKDLEQLNKVFASLEKNPDYKKVTELTPAKIAHVIHDEEDKSTDFLLKRAIKIDNAKVIKDMYENKLLNFSDRKVQGFQLVSELARYNSPKVLIELHKSGVNLNQTIKKGPYTDEKLIHVAAMKGNVDMLRAFDRCRLDLNIRNYNLFSENFGNTAAQTAKKYGRMDVFHFIVSANQRKNLVKKLEGLLTKVNENDINGKVKILAQIESVNSEWVKHDKANTHQQFPYAAFKEEVNKLSPSFNQSLPEQFVNVVRGKM